MHKYLKSFLVALLCLVCGSFLFGGVKFTVAPISPLFREFMADPYAPSSKFHVVPTLTEDSIPTTVYHVAGGEYIETSFKTKGQANYFNLKAGANIGFLRFEAGFFQIETYLNGGLNTIFELEGATDNLGFDGFYSVGLNIRLWDVIALQGGIHHFSGHWGDEILVSMAKNNSSINLGSISLLEYTRDNSWLFSLSFEPLKTFRLYTAFEIPMKTAWVRPAAHVPSFGVHPYNPDKPQYKHIAGQEGVNPVAYPDEYKAMRVQAGTEIKFPLFSIGSFFVAGDFQLHQDGQTNHQVDSYDQGNHWELTLTVGGGFEFNQGYLDRKIRIEAFYHYGRFPLLNFFYQRGHYISVGLAING